jgi:hypothetical protein
MTVLPLKPDMPDFRYSFSELEHCHALADFRVAAASDPSGRSAIPVIALAPRIVTSKKVRPDVPILHTLLAPTPPGATRLRSLIPVYDFTALRFGQISGAGACDRLGWNCCNALPHQSMPAQLLQGFCARIVPEDVGCADFGDSVDSCNQ